MAFADKINKKIKKKLFERKEERHRILKALVADNKPRAAKETQLQPLGRFQNKGLLGVVDSFTQPGQIADGCCALRISRLWDMRGGAYPAFKHHATKLGGHLVQPNRFCVV